jgi:uncharacterized integral membrane protein (TIGR00698 family)
LSSKSRFSIKNSRVSAFERSVVSILPGLLLIATAAVVARLLASVTVLPAVLLALLLGMGLFKLARNQGYASGIAFGSRTLLRCGVALLGVQITLSDFVRLGFGSAAVVLGSLAVTLILGQFIGRAFGLTEEESMVSAGAVAICGASAALAVAAALPRNSVLEQEVARTVACVTIIGTVAMVGLPFACTALGLSATDSGLLLGGAIHEVAQAVGAGFAVSTDVGEASTIVKLLRVACLGALVIAIGAISRRGAQADGDRAPLLPFFVIVFVVLAALSSIGVFPETLRMVASESSRWSLLIAIAALGTRVSPRALIAGGSGPLIVIAVNSALLILLILGGIWLLNG